MGMLAAQATSKEFRSRLQTAHPLVAHRPHPPSPQAPFSIGYHEVDLIEPEIEIGHHSGIGLAVADRLEQSRRPGDLVAIDLELPFGLVPGIDGRQYFNGAARHGQVFRRRLHPLERNQIGVEEAIERHCPGSEDRQRHHRLEQREPAGSLFAGWLCAPAGWLYVPGRWRYEPVAWPYASVLLGRMRLLLGPMRLARDSMRLLPGRTCLASWRYDVCCPWPYTLVLPGRMRLPPGPMRLAPDPMRLYATALCTWP